MVHVINRLVTTRQKKFLEKTFECLGISIDDLLEINNLRAIQKEKKELEERVKLLEENAVLANETINSLNKLVAELIQNQQRDAYAQIFKGFGEEAFEEVANGK
jgi:hypothetical protein